MDHFPVLVSADAMRLAAIQGFVKHGCHPDDEYEEGDCDWTITVAIHRIADGHIEETVDFTWGRYQRKTDTSDLAKALRGFTRAEPGEMIHGERGYGAGPFTVKIRGVKDRVQLMVTDKRGVRLDQRYGPKLCTAQGPDTIWGALTFWHKPSGLLIVRGLRACKAPILAVVHGET